MARNEVTLVVVPRERFSYSRQSLVRHFHSKWRLDDPDHRIVDQWLRTHRKDLFARLQATAIRFLGWRIGSRVSNGLVRLVESVVTPIARRKGHAALGRAPIEIAP